MRRLGGDADDRGAVAILVAAFSVVMFMFGALIVDLGVARVTRRDAQNAADASALAAADALYPSGNTPDFTAAVAAAKEFATSNYGTTDADWSACTTTQNLIYTPSGVSNCISFDSSTVPVNVRVVVPGRHVGTFFGGVVGYHGMDVNAVAQAQVDRSGHPTCVFCVVGSGTHSLQNGNITVTDGDIWFNGSVTMGPNGGVTTSNGTTYIAGTATPLSQVSDPKVVSSPTVTDPLAGTVTLPPTAMSSLTTTPKMDPCAQGPGYYGAVALSGSAACALTPGLYVFTDTLSIGGSRSVTGSGVTLYFTCGTGGIRAASCAGDATPGMLDAGGGNGLSISAPTTGTLAGLAILYDRDNTGGLNLQGGSAGAVTGTIYAPASKLTMGGSGCAAASHTMVVVSDFTLNGNGACFKTVYAGSNNVTIVGDTGLVL
jgi:Flp pilus assembly protein TadG